MDPSPDDSGRAATESGGEPTGSVLPSVGDVIADRYRLEVVLDEGPGWAVLWQGTDTVLARPVSVRVLQNEHPSAARVLEAARACAAVDDARFVKVLDVGIVGAVAHVVSTWAPGRALDAVLAEGPLDPVEAADLVADVADGLAAAHDAGQPHAVLRPEHVVVAPGGEVALIGLGVAAALESDRADRTTRLAADDATVDARALGALLYACLTARWPGGGSGALPDAERADGRPVPPRRARAGVAGPLDRVCRRALGEAIGDEEPLDDPRSIAAALRSWLGRSGSSAVRRAELRSTTADVDRPVRTERGAGSRAVRLIVVLLIAVLLVTVGVIAVQVLDVTFGEPGGSPEPGPTTSTSP